MLWTEKQKQFLTVSFTQWQLFYILVGKRYHNKNAQKEMRILLQKSAFHTGNVDED